MYVILVTIGWLAGIALAETVRMSLAWLFGIALAAGVGLYVLRRRRAWRWLLLFTLAFSLGSVRLLLAEPDITQAHLSWYNGTAQVTIRGVVVDRPDILGDQQQLRVRASRVSSVDVDAEVEGDLLVSLGADPRYRYGDEISVSGDLVPPPRFPSFDYQSILARRGIHSLIRRPDIHLLTRGQGNWLRAHIYSFKDRVAVTITRILPMPQSALLAGMLVGDESGIPTSLEEAFRTTGTSHIVVISGWNVAVLAGLVIVLFGPLTGRRVSLWLALAVVAGYTVLVGADPSVVRAAIMGGLTLLALLAGRQTLAWNSLALAAIAMTLIDPFMLWDLGFQLSFAATLGIILFQPPLKRLSNRGLARLGLVGRLWLTRLVSELILVTFSAQLLVVPILVYRLGELSLITLPANLIVLPAQTILLGLGAMATMGGLVWLPLGQLLGWLAWPFLTYTIVAVEKLAQLPGAMVPVPHITPGLLLLYYATALSAAVVAGWESDRRRQVWLRARRAAPAHVSIFALALLAILTWAAVFSLPDGRLHVHFLDVGQGDAILIYSPTGKRVLIDGGEDGPTLLSLVDRRLPFWSRRLDALIATHGDVDHVGGLHAAFGHYRVATVLDAGFDSDSDLAGRWARGVIDAGARRVTAAAGMVVDLGDGAYLEVLHPPAGAHNPDWSDNDGSVVVRLVFDQVAMLLPGDLERDGERSLLAAGYDLHSAVLKVAHHGAATATGETFLDAVSPSLAVISVGASNRYNHPAGATLRRLEDRQSAVWRTDEVDTIEVVTDGRRVWVRGWR